MLLAITALELPSADVVAGNIATMSDFNQNVNELRFRHEYVFASQLAEDLS